MPIPSSSTTLRLPAGFKNLLEGLALEVLRAQPADVVAFAAQHFQKLLEQREGEWSGPAALIPAPPSPAPCCMACLSCVASRLPCVPVTRCVAPAPRAHRPWHQACPMCPSPVALCLPRVPVTQGVAPAPCAHHPGCHSYPVCPLPMALCLPHVPIAQGTTPAPCAHP